jgi:hypothetical protein
MSLEHQITHLRDRGDDNVAAFLVHIPFDHVPILRGVRDIDHQTKFNETQDTIEIFIDIVLMLVCRDARRRTVDLSLRVC